MNKILQIFGVLFIVLVIGGVIVSVIAKNQYNAADSTCIRETKVRLAEIISKGTKDNTGAIVVNDPNIASEDEFKMEIESFYGNCMKGKGIPESLIKY